MTVPTTQSRARWSRRVLTAAAGTCLLAGLSAGIASAKEVGSGGTTTPPAACNPVSAITYKGDATTSDTATATIQISYGVRPCLKGQTLTVTAHVYLNADPSQVVYDDPAAALNGKFTVGGVRANTSYIAQITAIDAATGEVAGTQKAFVAAVYKGV